MPEPTGILSPKGGGRTAGWPGWAPRGLGKGSSPHQRRCDWPCLRGTPLSPSEGASPSSASERRAALASGYPGSGGNGDVLVHEVHDAPPRVHQKILQQPVPHKLVEAFAAGVVPATCASTGRSSPRLRCPRLLRRRRPRPHLLPTAGRDPGRTRCLKGKQRIDSRLALHRTCEKPAASPASVC